MLLSTNFLSFKVLRRYSDSPVWCLLLEVVCLFFSQTPHHIILYNQLSFLKNLFISQYIFHDCEKFFIFFCNLFHSLSSFRYSICHGVSCVQKVQQLFDKNFLKSKTSKDIQTMSTLTKKANKKSKIFDSSEIWSRVSYTHCIDIHTQSHIYEHK